MKRCPLRRWLIQLIKDAMRERGLDVPALRALTVGMPGVPAGGVWIRGLLDSRNANHPHELRDFDAVLTALGIELPVPSSLRGSVASSLPTEHEEAVI